MVSSSAFELRGLRPTVLYMSSFERRPLLLFPVFYGLLVPLLSPALWLLQTLSQHFEQTTHMRRMVDNPELFADHYSYPLTCPYLSPKTMRLGSLCQELGQFSALLLAETRCRSRGGLTL